MQAPASKQATKTTTLPFQLQYDRMSAVLASEFVISTTHENIIIDCSSGLMEQPGNGQAILPIHTRLAVSPAATKRLVEMLMQSLRRHGERQTADGKQQVPVAPHFEARLPKLPDSAFEEGVNL